MTLDLIQPDAADPARMMVMLGLCSVRTLVAFSVLPPFSSNTVPALVRTGLAIAVVFPVALARLDKPPPVDLTTWLLFAFILKEAAVGLAVGLGFGIFLAGLQTVGEIIDHQTGLTFSQNIDPVHGNHVSLTAVFVERLLFAALMLGGVLLTIVDTLYLSYEVWPLGHWAPAIDRAMLLRMVSQANRLFSLSLLLASPVLLVLFAVDACLGLLNRAAPQLSVFNITMSLKAMVGIGVLVLAFPMMLQRVVAALPGIAATLHVFLAATR
jgi:type III secretion protein T